jgi:hypothetical protein
LRVHGRVTGGMYIQKGEWSRLGREPTQEFVADILCKDRTIERTCGAGGSQ